MTAREAAELVAPFVNSSYPGGKEYIYSMIELGMSKAWKEGKWLGMTKEVFAKILKDCDGNSYINSPKGYSALLGINLDCKPRTFRSDHFMFHRNGYGDIKDHKDSCKWNEDVYDNGIHSTEIEFEKEFPNGAIIGARSLSNTGREERVFIGGDSNGRKVISFDKENNIYFDNCRCISVNDPDQARTIMGVEIPISRDFSYINNVEFSSIEFIRKSITQGPIEIVAFDPDTNEGKQISLMYPWETESKYHRYILPYTTQTTAHCLFKIEDQQKIVAENQPLIINEKEAIISLVMGIYFIYHKENIEMGNAYVLQGINALEKQKREEETEDTFPIQVVNMGASDTPDIFKRY